MADCEKVIKELSELHGSKETMEIIEQIIALLKEKEAVKPIVVMQGALPLTYTTVKFIKEYYCGICNEEITEKNIYCHRCGRKVKWND